MTGRWKRTSQVPLLRLHKERKPMVSEAFGILFDSEDRARVTGAYIWGAYWWIPLSGFKTRTALAEVPKLWERIHEVSQGQGYWMGAVKNRLLNAWGRQCQPKDSGAVAWATYPCIGGDLLDVAVLRNQSLGSRG